MEIILVILAVLGCAAGFLLGKKNGILQGANEFQRKITQYEVEKTALQKDKDSLIQQREQLKRENEAIISNAADTFKAIAADIVREHSKDFKDVNQKEMSGLIDPLKEKMNVYKETIERLHKEQMEKNRSFELAFHDLKNLNQNLSKEANELTNALQNKKMQGNWGEVLLERVLQMAGLQKGVNYELQFADKSEDSEKVILDCVVSLPDDRKVIIDSKMSLVNYSAWVNGADIDEKNKYLNALVEDIKNHIKGLTSKEYQKSKKVNGRSPDFVIMFIPIEYAYFAALEASPDLFEFAAARKIAIATASSLFPILKVVDNLWSIDKTSKNMEAIIKTGEEMHSRVEGFVDAMEDVGSKLGEVQKAYEKANTKLTGGQGIVKSAIKLERLGIKYNVKLEAEEEPNSLEN